MASTIPKTMKQWAIKGTNGFDDLQLQDGVAVPDVAPGEVLVKVDAVSLNYRDLIIPQGKYPFPTNLPCVPCSDGAGTVVKVGAKAGRWKEGDRVVTLFNQAHQGGSLDAHSLSTGLGGAADGTLRQYAAFPQDGLVRQPANLSPAEASTLCCAGLTAWNALYGLPSKAVKPGDWVLCQGTGGVSIFGVQFAKAAGATVVATTSSEDKVDVLKRAGADHVLNYRAEAEWGVKAKALTPGGRGMDHVLEVSGPPSMRQSLESVAIDGVITIIGFVGGVKDSPSFLDVLSKMCVVRGVLVGSRVQLEEMCRAVEAVGDALRPVVDGRKWQGIDSAKGAYEYMWGKGHVGKVVVTL